MASTLQEAADAFYAAGNRLLAGDAAEMGYMVCMERTRGMTQAGQAISTDIRSTTIWRKEDGEWRAVHHHTDRF
ncbi:MAG: nuclear transport factor 2 family protein [Cyanobium sp.]